MIAAVELRTREVRRIYLPRTRVNKGIRRRARAQSRPPSPLLCLPRPLAVVSHYVLPVDVRYVVPTSATTDDVASGRTVGGG